MISCEALSSKSIYFLKIIMLNLMDKYKTCVETYKKDIVDHPDYRKDYIGYIDYQLNNFKLKKTIIEEELSNYEPKTKDNIHSYLRAYGIPYYYFDEQLYNIMLTFLKRAFKDDQWDKGQMNYYECFPLSYQSYNIFGGKYITPDYDENSPRRVNINIDEIVDDMENAANKRNIPIKDIESRFHILTEIFPVLENHSDEKYFSTYMKGLLEKTNKIISGNQKAFK